MNSGKIPVAILGSGNIGTDLMFKINKSDTLFVKYFVGRNNDSKGLKVADDLGVVTSSLGFDFLVENSDYEIVFDATSASSHLVHAPVFENMGKRVVDMTPAKVGELCIPSINACALSSSINVNMVTCGGQTSLPILYAMSQAVGSLGYVEVVTSISSLSAGLATRQNLDEYMKTTELAIHKFTVCDSAKVILNLNPASPCVDMQTTIYCSIKDPDMNVIRDSVLNAVEDMRSFVPGYKLMMEPIYQDGVVVVSVQVQGAGDFLPSYAGNLDIINCAAVRIAEKFDFTNLGLEKAS